MPDRPDPLLCPACGATAVPVVRIVGYPDPRALALLNAGDAEIAEGCVLDDDARRPAPLRCRRCRRHLAASEAHPETLAELACDADVRPLRDGLYVAEDGRVLVLVRPVAPAGTVRFPLSEEHRRALRAARRPVVVLRVAGQAARFVSGRPLRRRLAVDGALELRGPDGLDLGDAGRACLRLPRVR